MYVKEIIMCDFAVQTINLSKSFDTKQVLKQVDLKVKPGSIYCVVGRNGAGKTTLFKALLGLVKPTEGIMKIFDNTHVDASTLARIGSVIETPCFYEHLSVKQNLEIHLEYMGCKDKAIIDDVLEQVGLEVARNEQACKLSLGMRQRLAIARAISHKPDLLILDEPTNGMDPVGIYEMRRLLSKLREYGTTILMSSHMLSEVELIADDIGFLLDGTLVKEISSTDISNEKYEGLEKLFIDINISVA